MLEKVETMSLSSFQELIIALRVYSLASIIDSTLLKIRLTVLRTTFE